jgi:hypothetical protein
MLFRQNLRENLLLIQRAVKWSLILLPLGILVGSTVAFFLWSLDWMTLTRWQHP